MQATSGYLDLSHRLPFRSARQPHIIVSYASSPYPCTDLFKYTTRHIVWLPVAQLCRDDTPFGKVRRLSFQRAGLSTFNRNPVRKPSFCPLTTARGLVYNIGVSISTSHTVPRNGFLRPVLLSTAIPEAREEASIGTARRLPEEEEALCKTARFRGALSLCKTIIPSFLLGVNPVSQQN